MVRGRVQRARVVGGRTEGCAGGVDETRSLQAKTDEPRPDGAQPRRAMRTRAAWSSDPARTLLRPASASQRGATVDTASAPGPWSRTCDAAFAQHLRPDARR